MSIPLFNVKVHYCFGQRAGHSAMDTAKIQICPSRGIKRHRVCKEVAARGEPLRIEFSALSPIWCAIDLLY
jgi:hypothetical protein